MDYLEYKRLADASRASLKLPSDCTEFLPIRYKFTSLHLWTVEWIIKFDDHKHMRLREHYTKVAALEHSQRKLFSFHYGATVAETPDGAPVSNHDDPVDIRVDNTITGIPHLHYGAPQPHHQQQDISGKLDLANLEMFEFARAVFKHRKSGKPIEDVLHFRLKAALR